MTHKAMYSYELPTMTRSEAIRANHAIIRAWIDDTAEHELSDRYVRTMLTGLVGRGRQCEPTPMHVRIVADQERDAALDSDASAETRELCTAAADVLERLADKLHELPAEDAATNEGGLLAHIRGGHRD